MKVFLGADHRGFALKEDLKIYLQKQGVAYEDLGTQSTDSVDYPRYSQMVSEKILQNPDSRGVLICNSGVGISIAANRYQGIRAALCFNENMAEMSRRHNDANILCLGQNFVSSKTAKAMLEKFLSTDFEGGRHLRRIDMIDRSQI